MSVLEKLLDKIEDHAVEFEAFGMADDYVSVGWVKKIVRSHMNEVENDGWIDCKKSMPTKNMDKKPVWIVYGSPMNLSVEFAYCDWTLSEDECGNDDSYTQFYIPQAPCLYYPSLNLVHYWKPVNIPKFKKE